MNSNCPKKPHYVPKLLLKNFVDSKGFLCVFDKKEGKFHQKTPKNTFVEKYLTRSYDFNNENYSFEAENILSGIETRADLVIKRIIECARNNEHPKLPPEDGDAWKRFYHAMCRRTPEFAEEMLRHDERFEDIFHTAVKQVLLQQGIELPPKRNFSIRILSLPKPNPL